MFYKLLNHIIQYRIRPQIKHLILHVTRRCNLQCRSCFVDTLSDKSEELSFEEIKQLSRYFKNLCFLDIGGGEPFLRGDLAQICQVFDPDYIGIPTNGTLKELIVKTVKDIKGKIKGELMISLSLDGFETSNDFIRGDGNFQKALSTYESLRKIKGISLKINTVLCNKNISELEQFTKFVRTLAPDFHSIIFIRGKPRDIDLNIPTIPELFSAQRVILENARYYASKNKFIKKFFFKHYYSFLIKNSVMTLKYQKAMFKCLAGSAHCVIYPEGDVAVCEMLNAIGNIRKKDFSLIWESQEAEALRRKINRGQCYCTHNCVMMDNFIFNLPLTLFQL